MQDRQYRLAIAWQNVGYNQPPHPGFYIGPEMPAPPIPSVNLIPSGLAPKTGQERFADWLASRGLPTDMDPSLDHDGNGYTLFTEYAFAIGGGPLPAISNGGSAGSIILTVNTPRDDLDYSVDHSTDLENWEHQITSFGSGEPLEFVTTDDGSGQFYRFSIPSEGDFNAFPEVILTAPAEGEELELDEPYTFSADATDVDGTVSSVEFILDGNSLGTDTSAPFTFEWTVADIGEHTLRAKATDDAGGLGFSPLLTFITKDTPEGGPVTYQAEDATYAPAAVGFGAEAIEGRDFRGTGYINFDVFSSLTFNNVSGGGGGTALLEIRYFQGASGTFPPPRQGALMINGVKAQDIALPETGDLGNRRHFQCQHHAQCRRHQYDPDHLWRQ